MKDLAMFVDITITVLAFIGLVSNIIISYKFLKDSISIYTALDFICKSINNSMFSLNKLSLINWIAMAVIYIPLAYYGQFVYIQFTAAVVVLFCIVYLTFDLIRPTEEIG